MKKFKIRSGDKVVVIAGANKGASGKVIKVLREKDRLLVEGVNMMKKHTKPAAQAPRGGIIQTEASLPISNIALVDPKSGGPTRVGYKFDDQGKKVRYAKKSGQLV